MCAMCIIHCNFVCSGYQFSSARILIISHSAGDHFRQLFGPYAGWAHSVRRELVFYSIVLVLYNCRYCSVLI